MVRINYNPGIETIKAGRQFVCRNQLISGSCHNSDKKRTLSTYTAQRCDYMRKSRAWVALQVSDRAVVHLTCIERNRFSQFRCMIRGFGNKRYCPEQSAISRDTLMR